MNIPVLQYNEPLITRLDEDIFSRQELTSITEYLLAPECTIRDVYLNCKMPIITIVNILNNNTSVQNLYITTNESIFKYFENLYEFNQNINVHLKYKTGFPLEDIDTWKKLHLKSLNFKISNFLEEAKLEEFLDRFLTFIRSDKCLESIIIENCFFKKMKDVEKLCVLVMNHCTINYLQFENCDFNQRNSIMLRLLRFMKDKISLSSSKCIKIERVKLTDEVKNILDINTIISAKEQYNELASKNIITSFIFNDDRTIDIGLQFGLLQNQSKNQVLQLLEIEGLKEFLLIIESPEIFAFFSQVFTLKVKINDNDEMKTLFAILNKISNNLIHSLFITNMPDIKFSMNDENLEIMIDYINNNKTLKTLNISEDITINFDQIKYFCKEFNNKILNKLQLSYDNQQNSERYQDYKLTVLHFLNKNNCLVEAIFKNTSHRSESLLTEIQTELNQLIKNNLLLEKIEVCEDLKVELDSLGNKNKLLKHIFSNFTQLILFKDIDILPSLNHQMFHYLEFVLNENLFEMFNINLQHKKQLKTEIENYMLNFTEENTKICQLPPEIQLHIISMLKVEDVVIEYPL